MNKPIDAAEINFHPTSFCDSGGRLFWWRKRLYRGISAEYRPIAQALFDSGIIDQLVARGWLIDSQPTDWQLPGYPLVLAHRTLPFVSYGNEWSVGMLRDAGLMMADMLVFLFERGYVLDVDTWDVLFDGIEPRYVDFCSFYAAETFSPTAWRELLDDFQSYFVTPLQLMTNGQDNLARMLLADYRHVALNAEFAALQGQSLYAFQYPAPKAVLSWNRLQRWNRKLHKTFGHEPTIAERLPDLRAQLEVIPIKRAEMQRDSAENLTILQQTLTRLAPQRALIVGSGAAAAIAARRGVDVVAIEHDAARAEQLYQHAKAQGLTLLPLKLDVSYPTPGQGVNNQTLPPATARLACELVVALSGADRLVVDQRLTVAQAVDALAAFCTRWLLVGFVPRDDAPPEYSCANFAAVLARRFARVELISAETQPIFLCEHPQNA